MQIRPILSSLMRHKTAALLIVFEITLSCAIICNAIYIIGSRVSHMQASSGVAEDEVVYVSTSSVASDGRGLASEDFAALQAIPGVTGVSDVNQIPYGGMSWASTVSLPGDDTGADWPVSMYLDDGHLVSTLGLRIEEGRGFEPEEILMLGELKIFGGDKAPASALVTRALADRIFPDGNAVGSRLNAWSDVRIVGVVEQLMAPGSARTPAEREASVILPVRSGQGNYAIRTAPERREEVLDAAITALSGLDPYRMYSTRQTLEQMRHEFYGRDRAAVWLLVSVCVALLAVTAFGIVGLASFWVQQRTRQIGVRRALGATRGQIMRYFQVENFLLTTVGIGLGMLLAYALNQWLMDRYELGRLPLYFLPLGGILLWLLGQAAVLAPARRAARVPPALATRSV